jgi:endoglucanase
VTALGPFNPTRAALLLAVGSFVALAAAVAAPQAPAAGGPDPFGGARLFVDRKSRAAIQVAQWSDSRPADARALRKIATRPQADWFGDRGGDVRDNVGARVSQITSAGALPVLVAYDIPRRDCAGPSGGGSPSPAAYETWIRQFAAGIGRRRAVVVLEPDATAMLGCLSREGRRSRFRLLELAVRILDSRSRASVYIDAGHSSWLPPRTMARRLRRAGVERARGFSVNVSNFQTTSAELSYGRRISRLVGGKPFVIDTSRNGRGPAPGGAWCNPPERGLGPKPTVRTGHGRVDAYLWIKRPGESDGLCNGGPPAGAWWPEYALGLARRAAD